MSVLSNQKLTEQLAGLLSVPRGHAERLVEATIHLIKDALLQGHQIDLEGFLSLQIVEEKARIVQLPDSNTRLIDPPRNTLVSTPMQAFEQELASVRLTPILLVVPQNDLFAQIVQHHFTQAGWNVQLAHDPQQTLHQIDHTGSQLVILDTSLPDAQSLLDHLKLHRPTNTVPTIALFPSRLPPDSPSQLRVRADQELVEPFEVAQLLSLAERELARSAEEELLFDQQVQLLLPGTQADLDRATNCARELLATSGLDEANQTAFLAAVREGVGNAIQHGCQRDPAKIVRILYLLDPNRVTVSIHDGGAGFNHRRYLQHASRKHAVEAARERHAEGGRGGLGILMMARAADKVEYNDKGNVVTLTKFLRPPDQPAATGPRAGHPQPQIVEPPDPLDAFAEPDADEEYIEPLGATDDA